MKWHDLKWIFGGNFHILPPATFNNAIRIYNDKQEDGFYRIATFITRKCNLISKLLAKCSRDIWKVSEQWFYLDEIEIQGENLIIFMLFVNKEKLIEFYNCKLMSDICLVRGIER